MFLKFYLFIFRERGREGGRKRGRETSMCGCLPRGPHQGPGPQPRHVPWLRIKPVTLWFTAHAQSTELHQPGLLGKDFSGLNQCRKIFEFCVLPLPLLNTLCAFLGRRPECQAHSSRCFPFWYPLITFNCIWASLASYMLIPDPGHFSASHWSNTALLSLSKLSREVPPENGVGLL